LLRLTKRCEYAIRAALLLAARSDDGYVQARGIAATEGLPPKFLESILLTLRGAGVLESKVGAGGGYRLTRPPEDIPVGAIVRLFQSPDEDAPGLTAIPAPGLSGLSGLTPITTPPDQAPPPGPPQGVVALDQLYAKMDAALASAVDPLTLADLLPDHAAQYL
jgi:Rrf2 family protein